MAQTAYDALRARFRELCTERDAIRERARPLREERDRLQGEIDALARRQKELAAQFKEIEKPLFYIDSEIATISRALKGATAEPGQE